MFADCGLYPSDTVRNPIWRTVVEGWNERTWLRADTGGIVEMFHGVGALIHEGDIICSITNPFKQESLAVEAPFTGLLAGVLENPVVYLGNPVCHLVQSDPETTAVIEKERGHNTEDS